MRNHSHPCIGFLVGLIIVIAAAFFQKSLTLPIPLWIGAFVPVGIGLITGGHLKKIKSPLFSADMESLPKMPQRKAPAPPEHKSSDWTDQRAAEYARVDGYMLTHVYRPSQIRGQSFDIFIFLVRHEKGTEEPPRKQFPEIVKAEFYFGDSWGNEVFTVKNTGGIIGVRTDAWGTFLATCRITFRGNNRKPITLFRYIDFHMLQDAPDGSQRSKEVLLPTAHFRPALEKTLGD